MRTVAFRVCGVARHLAIMAGNAAMSGKKCALDIDGEGDEGDHKGPMTINRIGMVGIGDEIGVEITNKYLRHRNGGTTIYSYKIKSGWLDTEGINHGRC